MYKQKSRLGRVLRTALGTPSQERNTRTTKSRLIDLCEALRDDDRLSSGGRGTNQAYFRRCIALRNAVRSEQGGACERSGWRRRFVSINEVEGGGGWKTGVCSGARAFGSGETLTSSVSGHVVLLGFTGQRASCTDRVTGGKRKVTV